MQSSCSVLRPYINSFSFLLGDMNPMHSIYTDLSLLILLLKYQFAIQYFKHTSMSLVPGLLGQGHSFWNSIHVMKQNIVLFLCKTLDDTCIMSLMLKGLRATPARRFPPAQAVLHQPPTQKHPAFLRAGPLSRSSFWEVPWESVRLSSNPGSPPFPAVWLWQAAEFLCAFYQ